MSLDHAIERLRNALQMHNENSTTMQSLASSVGDFLRDAATLRQQAGRVDEGMVLVQRDALEGLRSELIFIATNEPDWYAKQSVEYMEGHCEAIRRRAKRMGDGLQGALAQNTQGDGEAVAWLCDAPDDGVRTSVIAKALADMCERNGWTVQPLYLAAAPSQRAEVNRG